MQKKSYLNDSTAISNLKRKEKKLIFIDPDNLTNNEANPTNANLT